MVIHTCILNWKHESGGELQNVKKYIVASYHNEEKFWYLIYWILLNSMLVIYTY